MLLCCVSEAEKKFKYGKKNLRQHICQECQKIYQTYNGLRKHTQKHLNEQPYQCYTCNRQFSDRQHLQGHMTSHENDKFKCDNCEKLFGYLSGLRRHKLKCVDNKPDAQQNKRLMCHFCGYTCVRGDRLRDHMDGKHAKEGMHECPHCHKVFRWRKYLSTHIRIHKK